MPIVYKIDVISALREKGYSTYKIRKEKLFAESTLQAFRTGDMVSYDTLDKLCEILACNVGDILNHMPEET